MKIKRSSKWNKTKELFLKNNPLCIWCGQKANTVHHIVPVHIDKSLELENKNLVSMCQTRTRKCHFVYGHKCNWEDYNKDIIL